MGRRGGPSGLRLRHRALTTGATEAVVDGFRRRGRGRAAPVRASRRAWESSARRRAWRRRAGDDARAIHGPRAISRSRRAVASHLARVEVDGVERGGFYACAASRSGLGYAVSRRRRDSVSRSLGTSVGLSVCSSRRLSRSASHEGGRGVRSRAGRVGRLTAHRATRRGIVRAA